MELSLFSRDVIAMSTAVALSHNMFDAVLCLGVCDKIVPGLLIGAFTLLRLVLENLLGNAWKYTAKTRAAEVWLERRAQHPDTYTVRDNGAGFDMRFADRLFGVFQRLHSASDFQGTGIGLANIRERVIEAEKRSQKAKVANRAANDLALKLDRKAAGAYPIALVSYALVCEQYKDAKDATLVKSYLTYIVSADGQKAAQDKAGAAALSTALQTSVKTAVDAIK